jgi:hypothetical protein
MAYCQFCKEAIKDDAIICPHCHAVLQPDAYRAMSAREADTLQISLDRRLVLVLTILGALFGGFLVVGATLYGWDLKQAKRELETIRELNVAGKDLLKDTGKMTEEVKQTLSKISVDIDQLRGGAAVGDNVANALQQAAANKTEISKNRTEIERLKARMDALVNAFEALKQEIKNQPELSALQLPDVAGTKARVAPAVHQEDEQAFRQAVRFTQNARKLSPEETGGSERNWYELSFEVTVDDVPATRKYQGIQAVEKVVYKFDERWFSNSIMTLYNRDENFHTSLRVWGSTKVTTEIYIRGLAAPEIREERMRLA